MGTGYILGDFGCGGVCEITMRERGGEATVAGKFSYTVQ